MCLSLLNKSGVLVTAAVLLMLPSLAGAQPAPPRGGSSSLFDDALPVTGSAGSRDGSMEIQADGSTMGAVSNPFEDPIEPPPKSKEEVDREVRQSSFTAAITGLLPLNPGEIRKLLQRYDETQQAVEVPVYPYPEPEISVQTVSLDPGVAPPVIKLGVGHVTTLNVMDATGQPWPIHDISWAGNFEVLQPGEGSHVVRITPMSEFAYGNLSIQLVKMSTPITFTLKTQRDMVQYRFDARIPEFGPFAQSPLIEGGLSLVAGTPTLNSFLDGTVPEGAQRLRVSGVDGRTSAYEYNLMTYVRTPLTLLSPGWQHSVSSADGMNVYMMANAPVVLLSDRGRVVRARISQGDTSNE